MPSVRLWYFAYGSNLDILQMMGRVGEWETSLRAYVEGYRLIFNKPSQRWGGRTANIEETRDNSDIVYGVVYRLTEKKLDVLEEYEGKSPKLIDVKLEDGSMLKGASAFIFDSGKAPRKPPKAYANAIIDGLRQHGHGDQIVEKVKSLAY